MFTWGDFLSSFGGSLVGSGAIWSFLGYKLRKREVSTTEAKVLGSLHNDLEEKLGKLMAMKDEYADVRDGKIPVDIPENRLLQLGARIEMLSDDIISCEQRLAKLENRPTREFIDTMRPEAPEGVKVIVERRTDGKSAIKVIPPEDAH